MSGLASHIAKILGVPDPADGDDADLACAMKVAINRACNGTIRRDKRLTRWEINFIRSLMDRRVVDDRRRLSAKQASVICDIASKLPDILPL